MVKRRSFKAPAQGDAYALFVTITMSPLRKGSRMRAIALDQLQTLVGQELGSSAWRTVDQAQIGQFADATGDRQWIHVDVDRATAELGGPIAHGFLTLSLLPLLSAEILSVSGASRVINYGLNKVRFTAAVPAGAQVRLKQVLRSVEPRGEALLITRECIVEIQGAERPALVAEWLTLIYS